MGKSAGKKAWEYASMMLLVAGYWLLVEKLANSNWQQATSNKQLATSN
jgi:hypothetical protein